MRTINTDRESLKRIVESYGKEDVMKFVNAIDQTIELLPAKKMSDVRQSQRASKLLAAIEQKKAELAAQNGGKTPSPEDILKAIMNQAADIMKQDMMKRVEAAKQEMTAKLGNKNNQQASTSESVNEALDESQEKRTAIMKAFNELDCEAEYPETNMEVLETLYDAAADEGYRLGFNEGYNQGYSDCEDEYEK